MTDQQPVLFAIGLGYSGRALAARLKRQGWRVVGTSRTEAGAASLARQGFEGLVFNAQATPARPPGAHWLVSAPPGADGCPGALAYASAAPDAASVTYLSTTGVYGDLAGGWAFEWTPARPSSERGRRRVLAETQWRAARPDARLVRLPGIYGPGRSPFERLRQGSATRIVKPGQVFSRVHVDDIASGLEALLARPSVSGVLHLCDDLAAPPQEVTAFAAELLGVAAPPETAFEAAGLSEMARSFYAECKRVSNARAKAALGWRPAFATYREGLRAVLAAEAAQRPSTS